MTNGTGRSRQWWLDELSRRPLIYTWLLYALFLLVNNSINANSVWLELSRDAQNSSDWWEPWLWELSSAASTLVLAPALFWSFNRQPLRFGRPLQQIVWHACGASLFCLAHVALMVGLREIAYGWAGNDYEFGPWLRELWYEYRKDVWGYLNLLVTYQLCAMVWQRLRGEAVVLAEVDAPSPTASTSYDAVLGTSKGFAAANSTELKPLQHLLVKKLDKEFLLSVAANEYLEACGNYVNLYSQGRIYPLRATLSQLSAQLATQGFGRVHRSFAVNHAFVAEISYEPSGDGEILLKTGARIALSRRYKDEFRAGLTLAK